MSIRAEQHRVQSEPRESLKSFVFTEISMDWKPGGFMALGRILKGKDGTPGLRSKNHMLKLPIGATAELIFKDVDEGTANYLIRYVIAGNSSGGLPYISINLGGEVEEVEKPGGSKPMLNMYGGSYTQLNPWRQEPIKIGPLTFSTRGRKTTIRK